MIIPQTLMRAVVALMGVKRYTAQGTTYSDSFELAADLKYGQNWLEEKSLRPKTYVKSVVLCVCYDILWAHFWMPFMQREAEMERRGPEAKADEQSVHA